MLPTEVILKGKQVSMAYVLTIFSACRYLVRCEEDLESELDLLNM